MIRHDECLFGCFFLCVFMNDRKQSRRLFFFRCFGFAGGGIAKQKPLSLVGGSAVAMSIETDGRFPIFLQVGQYDVKTKRWAVVTNRIESNHHSSFLARFRFHDRGGRFLFFFRRGTKRRCIGEKETTPLENEKGKEMSNSCCESRRSTTTRSFVRLAGVADWWALQGGSSGPVGRLA